MACAGVSVLSGCCVPASRATVLRAGKMGTGEFRVGRVTPTLGRNSCVLFVRYTDDVLVVA